MHQLIFGIQNAKKKHIEFRKSAKSGETDQNRFDQTLLEVVSEDCTVAAFPIARNANNLWN